MPMGVQRSVTEWDPVMQDYTASSVEKTDILPVGVKKKKMIINSRIEVHEDLSGDTRPQVRKKQPSSIQITLSRYEGCSSKDVPKIPRKECIVKNGVKIKYLWSILCELPGIKSIHCKKEWLRRKLICVENYPPKHLSHASLVNLGTRFLLRG